MRAELSENRKFIEVHGAFWAGKFPIGIAETRRICGASLNVKIYQITINWKSIYLPANNTCRTNSAQQTQIVYLLQNFLLFSKSPGETCWSIFQLNILRLICCFRFFFERKINSNFIRERCSSTESFTKAFRISVEVSWHWNEIQKKYSLNFFTLTLSQDWAFWNELSLRVFIAKIVCTEI